MVYLSKKGQNAPNNHPDKSKVKFYKKKWFKIAALLFLILVIVGGVFAWKTDSVLNKISKGGLLSSIVHNLPGVKDELKGEKDGRINVALLGMRGENIPGGGTLADVIMVVSVKPGNDKNPADTKVSIVSVPRDLYVTVPGAGDKQKINAVHAYGEQKGKGQGLEDMKTILSEVTGIPINYAASINFEGFKQLVNAIGGVDITLDKAFEEPVQFNEPHVCDSQVFTVPTGQYEIKKYTTKTGKVKISAQYPLCTNPHTECGGDFKLPSGRQTLTGEQALCFVRSRDTSSDFERAKRQQVVIQLIKDKMTSVGTLSDFSKINGILDALGDNVRSDMQIWEMQRFYDLYKQAPDAQIYQRVLEDSEEGLLRYPGESAAGYILVPRKGDNDYSEIHNVIENIFTLPPQSDIKPKI